ncbi:unnamed protein product [Meloidogyne enterolobii]|uniref:Uncharacterized protein n=1 Tax=Meloidogyne enterolobii TaxID=390850 RepID=A0ACB0Z2F6_MELEN
MPHPTALSLSLFFQHSPLLLFSHSLPPSFHYFQLFSFFSLIFFSFKTSPTAMDGTFVGTFCLLISSIQTRWKAFFVEIREKED